MAKEQAPESDLEKSVMRELNGQPASTLDPTDRSNFNLVKGKPIPDVFQNPPCGEDGHLCVDLGGNYQPDWYQLMIEKMYEHQEDPQPFPLGTLYSVNLDAWTDVPPEIIESLKSAVEEHHSMNATAGQIVLGQHPERTTFKRKRFVYHAMKSE